MNRFSALMVAETRRRLLGEGLPRIEKCLAALTDEEVWWRPNDHSNSVGNLVLHLCGNLRQWVVSGIGGRPDHRQRQLEFDERGPLPKQALLEKLAATLRDVDEVLEQLSDDDLLRPLQVQGFDETGLSVLIHVVEHFSYHTGQITYFVKWKKDRDTGYYQGQHLDTTSP